MCLSNIPTHTALQKLFPRVYAVGLVGAYLGLLMKIPISYYAVYRPPNWRLYGGPNPDFDLRCGEPAPGDPSVGILMVF